MSYITGGHLTAVKNYLQISVLYHHKGLCLAHITLSDAGWWEEGIKGDREGNGLCPSGIQGPRPLLDRGFDPL